MNGSEQFTTLVELPNKKITRGGRGAIITLPKEVMSYITVGDHVEFKAIIEGSVIRIIATKLLFNFELSDIKKLIDENKFEIKYENNLDGIIVLDAVKKNFSLTYTQRSGDTILPANVTISTKLSNTDYDTYDHITKLAKKSNFKMNIRPEGDLDTINVLKDPAYYKLNTKKAFELLQKAKKKLGLSITISFNNKNNTIEEVNAALQELKKLDS